MQVNISLLTVSLNKKQLLPNYCILFFSFNVLIIFMQLINVGFSKCTISFIPLQNMPTMDLASNQLYLDIGNDGTYIYNGLYQCVIKNNIENDKVIYQNSYCFKQVGVIAQNMYFTNQHVFISAKTGSNHVFKKDTFEYIQVLTKITSAITNGYYIEAGKKFFFSTKDAKFGYFLTSQLPYNANPIFINTKTGGNAHCFVSLDRRYIANSFTVQNNITIYSTADYKVIAQISTALGLHLVIWTQTYLAIFSQGSKKHCFYKISDWRKQFCLNSQYKQIKQAFYVPQKNTIVCLDQTTSSMFAIDVSTRRQYAIDVRGVLSKKITTGSSDYIALTSESENKAYFFKISQCEELSQPQPVQNECQENCKLCLNESECSQCMIKFTLIDGQCLSTFDIVKQNDFDIQTFNALTSESLESVGGFNSVPASRKIFKPIFSFFVNFDNLWLYAYHKRQYSYHMASLLEDILKLQQQKWQFLSQLIPQTFKDQLQMIKNKLMFFQLAQKSKNQKYQAKYTQVQGTNRSFMVANLDFLLMNIPMTLIMFFVLKTVFYLLRNHKISVHIRQFSFPPYLFLMLAEGNIQSFTYFFVSDSLGLFNQSFKGKLLSILICLLFGFFLVFSTSYFFMVKYFYQKKVKYFTQNYKWKFKSLSILTFEYVLINIILGFIHIVAENYYVSQIIILAVAQCSYACMLVYVIHSKKSYFITYKMYAIINLLTCILRILFNISFLVDYSIIIKASELNFISYVQGYIIYGYVFSWFAALTFSIFCIFSQFRIFLDQLQCFKLLSQNKQSKLKQCQQREKQKLKNRQSASENRSWIAFDNSQIYQKHSAGLINNRQQRTQLGQKKIKLKKNIFKYKRIDYLRNKNKQRKIDQL